MKQIGPVSSTMLVLAVVGLVTGAWVFAPTASADSVGFTDTPTPTTAPDTPTPVVVSTDTPVAPPTDTPVSPTITPRPLPITSSTPHPTDLPGTATTAPEAEAAQAATATPVPATETATPTETVVPGVPITGGVANLQVLVWGTVLVAVAGISAILGRRLSA